MFFYDDANLCICHACPQVVRTKANFPYKMQSAALDAIAPIGYTSIMENKSVTPQPAKKPVSARDARLKAALKANLGRRKQLSRAKAATDKTETQSE